MSIHYYCCKDNGLAYMLHGLVTDKAKINGLITVYTTRSKPYFCEITSLNDFPWLTKEAFEERLEKSGIFPKDCELDITAGNGTYNIYFMNEKAKDCFLRLLKLYQS